MNKQIQPEQFNYNTDLMSQESFLAHVSLYDNYVNQLNSNISKPHLDTYSYNGAMLHELFFEQLSIKNELTSNFMIEFFNTSFNGYKNWKENFTNLAMKIRSKGWVATVYDSPTKSYKNIILSSHDEGIPFGMKIIIVGDFFEHSYWHDYFSNKKEYIEMFFKCIDWSVIGDRIKKFEIVDTKQFFINDKPLLAFDLDNVLLPFVEGIIPHYNKKYNDNIKFEDIHSYDFRHMLKSLCEDIFREFADEKYFNSIIPYPNVFKAIECLEQKYEVIFVTAGSPYTSGFREEWLKKWYKKYNSDKYYRMPCKQLLSGNIFGLVDDALEENILGGNYQSFLVTQPWNIQYRSRYLHRHNIQRIDSVCDLPNILL